MVLQPAFCPHFRHNSQIDRAEISNAKSSVAQSLSFHPTRTRVRCLHQKFNTIRLKFCPEIQQQQAVALPPPPPARLPKPRDDYESSGGDSEDDYVQERPQSTKTKKRSSLSRKPTDSGEQRKRKRRQPPPPVDLSELPPEQGKSPVESLRL